MNLRKTLKIQGFPDTTSGKNKFSGSTFCALSGILKIEKNFSHYPHFVDFSWISISLSRIRNFSITKIYRDFNFPEVSGDVYIIIHISTFFFPGM